MSGRGWIGVDLDGTLAYYDGWKGIEHIGEPVPAMLARVRQWLADGIEVRIFTARVTRQDDMSHLTAMTYVRAWLDRYGLPIQMQITNVKDFGMVELWDDRARQVEENTGRVATFPTVSA